MKKSFTNQGYFTPLPKQERKEKDGIKFLGKRFKRWREDPITRRKTKLTKSSRRRNRV